ncbi:MAG: amino acid adenylation domain-containing protein [Acidimicrobiales bacterium]
MTGETIPDLVEAQVARTPEAVAVVDGGRRLTYAELDARANRLAHHLQGLGIRPEVPVAISMGRSLDMAVGLLGILKAGGACLPLDPAYPPARLTFMLEDSAAPVLVTEESLAGSLPASGTKVVHLGPDRSAGTARRSAPPPRQLSSHDLAYLLYTSGSTGQPKGVMLEHGALVHHHRSAIGLYQLGAGDRVLQFCSISFDVSVEELFPTWASGATVVLRPDDLPILGRPWVEWLDHQGVTMLNLPTAYWHEWVADLAARNLSVPAAVRLVVVGGDRALGAVYRTWQGVGGDRVRWINAYGPTEAAVMATVYEPAPPSGGGATDELEGQDPPIGRPLPHATVRLLDGLGQPVPTGVTAELHIGGPALARGYLNRPDLTAERFIADPFAPSPHARLYRTGDLARSRPDGDLEFVGRVDDQVKVRGFRIECGEVEAALAVHPAVAGVAVMAREDRPGDKRLVAYIVGTGDGPALSSAQLRHHAAQRLPAYMVPTEYVVLDALPLTPNGKLDRRALPAPVSSRRDGAPTAPRSPTEKAVAAIWGEVLGIGELGVDDDFFDLGGHSLLATQAIAQVREVLGQDVPLRAIFEAPTVATLAARIDAERPLGPGVAATPPLAHEEREPGQRLPLSLPQVQMWRLEAQATPRGLYNVTAEHRMSGPVDEGILRRTLALLAQRHDILRTSFSGDQEGPWQSVAASVPIELAVTDLRATPADEEARELAHRVREEDARPFDVDRAPLFRAHLFLLGEETSLVTVTFDHLVSDGTSAYIFLSELAAVYDAFVHGRQPALRPVPVQYADFAVWQRQRLTDDRLDAQLAYWREKLDGMPLGPAVPFDRVPTELSRRIVCPTLAVPPEVYRAVHGLERTSRASVFVACVAALQAVASRMGGTTDVVLSTTLSGRNRPELEGVIGFFAGVGRIRTDLSGDPSFGEVMARARDSVLGLFDNQDVPFMRVRDALLPDFPTQVSAVDLMAVLPIEIQYFHAAHDEWAPGFAVIERPGPDKGPDSLFFRGQLPPLSVTFLDDGNQLWAECNYKVDFYDATTVDVLARGLEDVLSMASTHPHLRLSELPVGVR